MAYTFKHGDRPLENFTIQRAIGRGGFGEVYYAVSDGGREVALKYLKENPHVELRGVSNCINLKSPYLVSIFDVNKSADGEYFIVMEYCSGPSLRDLLIAEPKGFAPEKAAFFCREIGKGLAYLHDRGIVHRDLKPGNIFFDDGYVKIGDYGLSKFIAVSRHSAQTASVGTVHYMAPEIGSGDYSKGVDIYAMGVMLYEMVLGKVPFEGSSMAEVLMKHLTTQPELDELSPQFGKVIRKALQKDPKDRYQTIDEMIDDLLVGEDIQKSLAGFSAKSLEGAVRAGGRDRFDSPVPSPNPPQSPRGFVFKADIGRGSPPSPLGAEGQLPAKLARKMEAISRKIDKKVAKLGNAPRLPGSPPPLPDHVRDRNEARWGGVSPVRSGGPKKVLLLGLLTVGLSVGFGVAVGAGSNDDERGASAGLLVGALYLSIVLGRRAVRWFGVQNGPGWADRLIRAATAAPLLAIGSAPILDKSQDGVGLFLGLLALTAIKNWDAEEDNGTDGEIHLGSLFGVAIFALFLTAVVTGITGGDPEHVIFIAAGAAAAATFILQAGAWWTVHRSEKAALDGDDEIEQEAGSDEAVTKTGATKAESPASQWISDFLRPEPDTPKVPSNVKMAMDAANQANADWWKSHDATNRSTTDSAHARAPWTDWRGRRPRALFARVFWSLVSFGLMSGSIVTFLYPLIARPDNPHDITLAIILCVGFAAAAVFSLRKTTPLRQPGFWRETIRPFLISVSLFGIGGTTTAIAREWDHTDGRGDTHFRNAWIEKREALRDAAFKVHALGVQVEIPVPPEPPDDEYAFVHDECSERPCLDDEQKTAVVGGLVMSSISFLGLTFLTGRSPRRKDGATQAA